MKKILCVDFCSFKGHHETYFMKVVSTLIEHEFYVFAHTVDNLRLAENIHNQNLENCQIVDLELSIGDKLARHFLLFLDRIIQGLPFNNYLRFGLLCNLVATKRLIAQVGENIPVFFCHLDSSLPVIPPYLATRFLPNNWSGIYIRPSYRFSVHLNRFRSRQCFLAEKNLAYTSCKSILVLDSAYQAFFKKTSPSLNCILLPELCLDSRSRQINRIFNIAKAVKEKSLGRTIVSILGVLTKKKNLLLFLESAQKLNPEKYFLVIIGQLYKYEYSHEEIKLIYELVQRLKSNAFIKFDYYISDEAEFDDLISLSDILYLQYQQHPFSSNILTRAMMFRKPVIVSPGYLMEKMVKQYNWHTVAKESCDDILGAIHSCETDFNVNEECYSKFRLDYSEKSFETALLKSIEYLGKN